jgi:crotonobetainyl-CoA:carnitine CoA-transferase CaiB-like acyl-CoA transferase
MSTERWLEGLEVLNLAINIPADVAAWRLGEMGARVTKVEPPIGDGVEFECPDWYSRLTAGHEIHKLDLKDSDDRGLLAPMLERTDVLITSTRPAALQRLGLGWDELASRHESLVQVAIVGHAAPDQNVPGHDLTYVATVGLLAPPDLPRTLIADMGGAERTVSTALALLRSRADGGERYAEVALAEAADYFAQPMRAGLTADGGLLMGGTPHYGIYRTADGWIALASLEPHFARGLLEALELDGDADREAFAAAFATRSTAAWEDWAAERDLPISAVA